MCQGRYNVRHPRPFAICLSRCKPCRNIHSVERHLNNILSIWMQYSPLSFEGKTLHRKTPSVNHISDPSTAGAEEKSWITTLSRRTMNFQRDELRTCFLDLSHLMSIEIYKIQNFLLIIEYKTSQVCYWVCSPAFEAALQKRTVCRIHFCKN